MPDVFVTVPIETDPDTIAQIGFDYLQEKIPGWLPSDGQLDTWILTANGRQCAELRDVASDVPASIFRYFGADLAALPPQDAVSATVQVTITAIDNAGYTIPEGAAAGIRDAFGELWGFRTTADVIIPAASTTVTPVTLVATDEGSGSSGLGVIGGQMVLISSIAAIASITLLGPSSGGVDAELDSDYLDRLSQDLALQSPAPIVPNDFAILAKTIAGVGRATAINLYNAVTFNNAAPRTMTVAVAGINGLLVTTGMKTAVANLLASLREVNWNIFVIDPTYTTVDVQATVVTYPGFVSSDVQASIQVALASFLSPATWGQAPFGDSATWNNTTVVGLNDLIAVIGRADGVRSVTSVLQRTGAGAYAAADLTLGGVAPLPTLGSLGVTAI